MFRLFLVAVSFLTRLPVKVRGDVSERDVADSSTYFGLVGAVIGATQGVMFWALFPVTPLVAAVGSTIVAVLITGAFHHDGLADAADAFVGGWTPEQRQKILKDSRLGTYGVMALVLVVLFEVALLAALEPIGAIAGLIGAHTVSRTAAVMLAAFTDKRGSGLGDVISDGARYRMVVLVMVTAMVVGLCWLTATPVRNIGELSAALLGVVGLGLVAGTTVSVGIFAKSKVGAVTGDTLGAAERISFNIFLLGWVLLHTA